MYLADNPLAKFTQLFQDHGFDLLRAGLMQNDLAPEFRTLV